MNLHRITRGIISRITPNVTAYFRQSLAPLGADEHGIRTPRYKPAIAIRCQVQPASSGDIRQSDHLTLQNRVKILYINGDAFGVNRPRLKGGDLFEFGGSRWLVVKQIEEWDLAGWCKILVTEQLDPPTSRPEGTPDGSENIFG